MFIKILKSLILLFILGISLLLGYLSYGVFVSINKVVIGLYTTGVFIQDSLLNTVDFTGDSIKTVEEYYLRGMFWATNDSTQLEEKFKEQEEEKTQKLLETKTRKQEIEEMKKNLDLIPIFCTLIFTLWIFTKLSGFLFGTYEYFHKARYYFEGESINNMIPYQDLKKEKNILTELESIP